MAGVKFYPLLWLIILVTLSEIIFAKTSIGVLKTFTEQMKVETSKQVEELNNKLKKLQKQLDYNRLTLS